jgi:transposase-like protein
MKSRRGAPKRVNTEGFACPNHQCPYYGITDAHIHALVGDGKHGHAERIQTFRCQACHSTFTSRRHTPLYRLKTPSQQIATVLSALAEGLDASAAERIFGYRQATITTWLTRAGEHAQTLHEHCFRNLHLPHLQLDELRTRLRSSQQVLWLWLAIDPLTRDSSSASARPPHATDGACPHPFSPTEPGSWLHPALYQLRLKPCTSMR